jgi:hypothetical protein
MEWLGPNPSHTELWPVPSMATKVKSSETPERQLPAYNHSTDPTWERQQQQQQQQQQRVLSHQIKSKSTQLSDWWVPQLNHLGCNTSPTSLPSMLGSASVNEISDLESPNLYIRAPALNFKFSDEESTIQSQSIQSIHEASDIHSVPGNETLLRIASPQSLMTVATPTVEYPTDEEYSVEKGYRKVTTNVPRAHPTPSTASISMPATQGDIGVSPHSTITHESFQQAYDDYSFKPLSWLRRCVILGILVAIIGAITVVAVIMTNNGRKDEEIASKPNTEEEWMNVNDIDIDIMTPTTSPTGAHSFTKTVSPTIASSLVSGGGGGGQTYPTNQDNMPDSRTSSSPTSIPTQVVVDTPPPTSSPPKPTGKPTAKPTSVSTLNPTSKPSFSNEQIQELTWNRIVNGEDVWRPSEEEIVRTPLWYFAADDKTQGINLEVLNASRDDRFLTQLRTAVDDYS